MTRLMVVAAILAFASSALAVAAVVFQCETRWAAHPLDLLREMVKHKPTVVHFCGGRVIGGANGVRPGCGPRARQDTRR